MMYGGLGVAMLFLLGAGISMALGNKGLARVSLVLAGIFFAIFLVVLLVGLIGGPAAEQ